MKKYIKITAVSLFMSGLFLTPLQAETQSTTIRKVIPETYTVTIPKTIDITEDSASISISAEGNIEVKNSIYIRGDSNIKMNQEGNSEYDGTATLSGDWYRFRSEELEDTSEIVLPVYFTEKKAGTYTGVINFEIQLAEVEPTAL